MIKNGLKSFGLALVALSFGCTEAKSGSQSTTSLPPTEISRLDGTSTTLTLALAGEPALVNFWATWCEACNRELPALNRLSREVTQAKAGLVLGVDEGESIEAVTTFVREHGVTYPELVDGEFRLSDAIGERRVPTTLVVDRTGRVIHRGGALDGAALEAFRHVLH